MVKLWGGGGGGVGGEGSWITGQDVDMLSTLKLMLNENAALPHSDLSLPHLTTVFNLILVVYHDHIWAVNLPFAVNFQYIRRLFLRKWATNKWRGDTSLF